MIDKKEVCTDLKKVKEYLEKYPEDPSLSIYMVWHKEWVDVLGFKDLAWVLSHPEQYGMPSKNDVTGFIELVEERLGGCDESIEDWSI